MDTNLDRRQRPSAARPASLPSPPVAAVRSSPRPKYLTLNDSLYQYVAAHRSDAADPLLAALREHNSRLGEDAKCQISEEQGSFLTILARSIHARTAIEVGTFTGYSSICIARGLTGDGRLICVDRSKAWTDVARRFWDKAGLGSRIELRLGDAVSILKELEPELVLDFAFIDGAKDQYASYYELILPHVRADGLILFDNMLWAGRLAAGPAPGDPLGQAIDRLNRELACDPRVETVLLPIADGIQLVRKR
jgi:caffeoyl-CoA O-methyltransferase